MYDYHCVPPSLSGTTTIFSIAIVKFSTIMSQFQSGKESKKIGAKKAFKSDKKEKSFTSDNPRAVQGSDFPSPEVVDGKR